jgi:putative tryptophan/tyrosine transport system substrate-binding protein
MPLPSSAASRRSAALRYSRAPRSVENPEEVESAFRAFVAERLDAVIVFGDPIFQPRAGLLAAMAIERKLMATSAIRPYAEAGFLASYGVQVEDTMRQAARFVDKIFRGANPGDIPVEQPTNFRLVVNLKTASAIDLTIPSTVIARADEVIE